MSLELFVNDCHILVVLIPFIAPQPASNLMPLFIVFELSMLGRLLKFNQNSIPLLQAVLLVLPDLELLSHRGETLLTTQAEKTPDFG